MEEQGGGKVWLRGSRAVAIGRAHSKFKDKRSTLDDDQVATSVTAGLPDMRPDILGQDDQVFEATASTDLLNPTTTGGTLDGERLGKAISDG